MRRTLFILALLGLAAAPAAAQPALIQPGQTVMGEISLADPGLADKSHYDVWRFNAEPGHMYHVVLRSEDFDVLLAVGPRVDGRCEDCQTDDDGAGGTDAELRFTPGAAGTYEIRANPFNAKDRGRYTLTLEDEGAPPADTVAPPGGVVPGVPALGRLEPTDEAEDDGSYLDTYTYRGRRGETLVITLRSDDFDAYVRVGQVHHRACRPVQGDDNGAGGTDSRMRVRIPEDGDFHIHVSSRRAGETGDYTLTVERG
jgi:hypothetical protein